jgi:ferredoxin
VRRPVRLRVDPIACTGHGLCAELLPELIRLDDWGYPIISDSADDMADERDVRRAIAACPVLALRLEAVAPLRPRGVGIASGRSS